jgi:hypothetical protein
VVGSPTVSMRDHTDVGHVMMPWMVGVMGCRQQESILQILDNSLVLDSPAKSPTLSAVGDILGRHGPSWTKNA